MKNSENITQGVIVKGIGGFYYVKTADSLYECRARGKFRKDDVIPAVGDRVEIQIEDAETGSVSKILPRSSELVRPPVANVEQLLIVVSVVQPEPNFMMIDKLLVTAESKGIESILCVNKTDLSGKEECETLCEIYRKAGYPVFLTCAKDGEGINEVEQCLSGKVTAVAGNSGVGKSSLLSPLTGQTLKTGSVSKIERGKHTTRHVELLELPSGGYVLDTPGFSSIDLEGVTAEELRLFFPELEAEEGNCKFRGCHHVCEPGCAVIRAKEEGRIASSRYENYKELFHQLEQIKEWQSK